MILVSVHRRVVFSSDVCHFLIAINLLGIPVYSGNLSSNMQAVLVQNMLGKYAEYWRNMR